MTERQRVIDAAKAKGWSVLSSGPDDMVLTKGPDVIIVGCSPSHVITQALVNEEVITRGDRSKMAKIIEAVRRI